MTSPIAHVIVKHMILQCQIKILTAIKSNTVHCYSSNYYRSIQHSRLPNYTLLIVLVSVLHPASHHQIRDNQAYLQPLLVGQYKSHWSEYYFSVMQLYHPVYCQM